MSTCKLTPTAILSPEGPPNHRYPNRRQVPDVGTVVANDLEAAAVESIRRNVAFAGEAVANVVIPMETDARVLMLQLEKSFDVVDLDPYGTPAMFLDSAMQTVKDGGLMLITATDMAVLCGNNKEVCLRFTRLPCTGKARCTRGCVSTQLREVSPTPGREEAGRAVAQPLALEGGVSESVRERELA